MRGTYSFGIASVFGDSPPYGAVTSASNELKRSGWPSCLACCALVLIALTGCSGVAVTANPGGTSGIESAANPPPPVVNGAPVTSAQVGVLYDYTPDVADALGHALTFDITNMPAWATFNAATGELKGIPAADDVGTTADIEIGVSDGAGQATIGPFRITITAAQSSPPAAQAPPVISGNPAANAAVGQVYSFTPSASDPNGDTLSFSIVNRPSWASFNTTTGELSGKPAAQNLGSFANITISVSNGAATASLPAFTVTVSVLPVDAAPAINGVPAKTVNAGAAYSFIPTASDPNGLALTFSIQNKPTWASFNTTSGQLSGTPAAADVGEFANIVISVSNGTATAALAAFTITVSAAPNVEPPSISGTPATSVTAGSAYSFTPTASDPAGLPLTFSIQNQPSWANFNTNTGRLSGTPSAANVGTFANIKISVSNGAASASLPAFNITVSAQPVDGPPKISGNPPTSVNAGSPYSFTPTASDPLGHALVFSIANPPSWASFNTNTGQLSGTPSAADVGTYANITISASNDTSSASLPAFTINVIQISTGSANVTWTTPTQNTNGTPLVNLAGFIIQYGTSPANLNQTVQIDNPGVNSYVIGELAPGTWYFALVDYTSTGVDSSLSNIGSKTIQ
jgi:hypothetical protein